MATTTPNYGWDVPTSTDYVKDGATAIETLGDDIDATLWTALGGAYPGLRLVKKQTIGTGVTTVSVTSAFSATYTNYKIIVEGGTGSGLADLNFQLTGITTGYYSQLTYGTFGSNSAPQTVSASNGSSWSWVGVSGSTQKRISFELLSPFENKIKTGIGDFTQFTATGSNGVSRHWCDTSASATGFSIISSGATLTGGTIYVYGYGAS